MSVELDPRTLVFAAFFVTIMCAIALAVFWVTSRGDRAVGYCTTGLALVSLGIVMLVLRGRAPELISIVLASALMSSGLVVLLSGVRMFAQLRPLPAVVPIAIGIAAAAWFHYWSAIEPLLAPRLVFNAALVGICSALAAFTCLERGPSGERSRRLLGWVMASHGLFTVCAAVWLAPMIPADGNLFAMKTFVKVRALEGMVANLFVVVLIVQLVAERLRAQLEADSITDALTGVMNRRGFESAAHQEFRRRDPANPALMFTVLDIDYFKRVNDRYGHSAGDVALRHVAQELANTLRPAELVGRIGGEEFAVVVRLPDETPAATVAERLREAIEAKSVWLDDSNEIRLTISAGFAIAELARYDVSSDEQASALFSALSTSADKALYEAKHAGRNRVCQGELEAAVGQLAAIPTT